MKGLEGALVFFLQVHFVLGVYFSMTNVKFTVPRAIKKIMFHPYDHAIVNLTAINSESKKESNLMYSINGTGEYFQINSKTGGIFFDPKFFSQIDKIGTIPISVSVKDTGNSDSDKTVLHVSVSPLDNLDCDEFVEEICFWSEVTYKVERTNVATSVGPLSSPRWLELCPFRINYSIESDSLVQLIPPDQQRTFWTISTNPKIRKSGKTNILARLSCNVETISGNKKGNIRNIEKDINIVLFDIDRHLPVPQFSEITIELQQRKFKKGDIIHHSQLIFIDDDSASANHYRATIDDGNDKSFLRAICTEVEFSRDNRNKPQTAVHCKLEFKQDMIFRTPIYSFTLILNDTSFNKDNVVSSVELPIHLAFKDIPESLTMLKLYPSTPKIFRSAAPLARVAQPNTNNKIYNNFKLVETSKFTGIFGVTKTQGIIFVHDYHKLRNITTQFLSINISWTKEDKIEFDEIQVRIVTEPNQTCANVKEERDWSVCSEYETMGDCLRNNSCGIGTGGSSSVEMRTRPERCMWRGDEITTNITHLYSTCTPDKKNCPDGECDSLEQLHPSLCPQDCTNKINWPLKLAKTGLGVDEASGTVVCTPLGCTVIKSRKSDPRKKKEEKSKKQSKHAVKVINSSLVQNENVTLGAFGTKCDFVCMIGVGSGTLFIIGSIIFIIVCLTLKKTKKSGKNILEKDNQELTAPLSLSTNRGGIGEPLSLNFQMNSLSDTTFINNIVNKYTPDPKWEFPRSQLVIEQTLGEGEFGKVLRAKAQNIAGKPGFTTVAVKTLKDDARESELSDLLSEYQLLKEVSHPNVIRLLGVCTAGGGPVYLIIEYAEFGSLRNYLRRTRHLQQNSNLNISPKEELACHYDEPKVSDVTPKDLLSFAWQICNGMSYLSDMKLVHRDLAARNVLLSEEKVCKVSDFGLTRDVYEDNAYLKRSKGRVPVKWMAPESLADHIYTTKSDVWSFGILIWELVTLGATPYPGIAVQNLFHLLRQGYRMERPDNCSPGLYKIMRSCWHLDPEQRPSFLELNKWFAKLLEDKMEYINLSNNAIYNKGYFISPFEEEEENNLDENLADSTSDISPLNYLSRTTSYEKCDAREKEINEELEKITDNTKTRGYETPVKVVRQMKTPSNEDPQEYTNMGGN